MSHKYDAWYLLQFTKNDKRYDFGSSEIINE